MSADMMTRLRNIAFLMPTAEEALNEIERLRAENAKLREAGADCANDLEAYISAEYPEGNRDNYPHIRRQYERCIAPVEAMRSLLLTENLAQDSDRNR